MSMWRHVARTTALYPRTRLWITASVVMVLVVQEVVTLSAGIIITGLVGLLDLIVAVLRELHVIHRMVDGQRAEMLERIDMLTQVITDKGWPLPPERAKTRAARREIRAEKRRGTFPGGH